MTVVVFSLFGQLFEQLSNTSQAARLSLKCASLKTNIGQLFFIECTELCITQLPQIIEVTLNAMPSPNSKESNQTPIFIDFEASSLDLLSSYPIEVGICLANGETKSWLIKPHVLWKDWSEKAARIHGISKVTLEEEGQEISDVIEALNKQITGTVYCDAWAFDSFWLHRLFKAGKCKPNFELDSITSILNEEQIDQWQAVRASVIENLEIETHRAANDALILHKTWKAIGASI